MAESGDQQSQERPRQKAATRLVPSVQVIGWAIILLILAGYFAWMIVEMGAHAVPRAWPMVALIVAAIAGAVAATLGLVFGRRGADGGKD
jgi:hypothetical protein